MPTRNARAVWEGNLKNGHGTMALGRSGLETPYSFASRFKKDGGSNPEEMIGAAHAGCFSMALAHELSEAGHPPVRIETSAHVHLEKQGDGFVIPKIDLDTEAEVPGVDDETFHRIAEGAKENCPVSKLLAAAQITLDARLLAGQKK